MMQLTLAQAFNLAAQQQQAGQLAAAREIYQKILEAKPGLVPALLQLGIIHKATGELDEAVNCFRAVVEREPNDPNHNYQLGESLQEVLKFHSDNPVFQRQSLRNFDEADGFLRRAVALRPDFVLAHFRQGYGLRALGRYDEAVRSFEECLRRVPTHFHALRYIIECLERLGRHEIAADYRRRALTLYPNNATDFENQEFANPTGDGLGNICQIGAISPLEGTWHIERNLSFFPRDFDNNLALDEMIQSYIMQDMRPLARPLFDGRSKILTFGSCFAIELRKFLARHSSAARNISIPEGLNNTFAMRYFIEWCLTGDLSSSAYWYDTADSGQIVLLQPQEEQQYFKEALQSADGFIFTLGLAEVWRDKTNGHVFWRGVPQAVFNQDKHELVVSNAEENAANIQRIYELIQEHCGPKPVLFTVSPIPLNATFRDMPCVLADCASKSILRTAVEYLALKNLPNAYYFPSFEVIRWLGAHMRRPTFGDPKANASVDSRHVPPEVVEAIVKAFIRFYFAPDHGLT